MRWRGARTPELRGKKGGHGVSPVRPEWHVGEVRKGLWRARRGLAEDSWISREPNHALRFPAPGIRAGVSGRGVRRWLSEDQRPDCGFVLIKGELPALQVVKHPKSIGIGCFCVKSTGFLGCVMGVCLGAPCSARLRCLMRFDFDSYLRFIHKRKSPERLENQDPSGLRWEVA